MLAAGRVAGSGVWNLRERTYVEELQDGASLAAVQAVTFDPGGFVRIPPSWMWIMPDGVATGQPAGTWYTDTPFRVAGSATSFTAVVSGTLYDEEVRLYERFFSAATDMNWKNDCSSGSASDSTCLVYSVGASPVEASYGARSNSVLLVPHVAGFNAGQEDPPGPADPVGSGDYFYAHLSLAQLSWRDIMVAGQPMNMTWRIRSPGWFSSPDPTADAWNDRLARFMIRYTRSQGASGKVEEYLGGATYNCKTGNLGNLCLDLDKGCPIWVSTTPGQGMATLYLNDPVPTDADAPYTPYSFSFAPGSTEGAPSQWDPKNCAEDPVFRMNNDLCNPEPNGFWTFAIGSFGGGDVASESDQCPSTGVECLRSRLAGSVYIDGMTLSAARGAYISPVFDSLSPYTTWDDLEWDLELNPDGGGIRTPVGLSWRSSDLTTIFGTGSTSFIGVLQPAAGLAGCELDTTAGPAACSPTTLTTGRYFQWRGDLRNWAENPLNPPPSQVDNFTTYPACTRHEGNDSTPSSIEYDGSLSPRVRQVSVRYAPYAGRFTSDLLSPEGLRNWNTITYQKDDGGGIVTCDIVDAQGGVILAGVASGDPLATIDVGRYPGIAVRFTLDKGALGTADPRVHWFKLTYESMKGCLAIDRNALRLSRGDRAAIRFCTRTSGPVDVKVHDAAGQLVHRLYSGELKPGEICQKYWWGTADAGNPATTCDLGDVNPRGPAVAPGLYIVTVITPAGRETARLAVSR